MKYVVISEFVDRRNGLRVSPGQDVPHGLDALTVTRLVRARCLAPADSPEAAPFRKQTEKPDKESGDAGDTSGDEGKSGGETGGSKTVAGGNNGAGGKRAESKK